MIKTKLIGYGALALAGGLFIVSLTFADATPLAVSCSGIASGTEIAWSAVATGGTAPYSFAWSNDSEVADSTSTSVVGTYVANGTYTADIMATDASSTIATSSCEATVKAFAIPAPTSTLDIFVAVNNATSGTATASNFTVNVNGANASLVSFTGSASATPVIVNAAANYSVGISSLTNYTASESGNCSGPITAGAVNSCTITETYVAPGTVVTPPVMRINPPTLSIGANGSFLARGMTVTSVGTNSFTAVVWGVPVTVNWSGSFANSFEFWYRYNEAGATTTPTAQLSVGDEVGVSGMVTSSSSSPIVVTASVVRDYSILVPRPMPAVWNNGNGKGNGNNNGKGNESTSSADNNTTSNKGGGLLKQFENLFHFRFGH